MRQLWVTFRELRHRKGWKLPDGSALVRRVRMVGGDPPENTRKTIRPYAVIIEPDRRLRVCQFFLQIGS